MGGFTAFRNHLFNLFPHVFMRNLSPNTVFCMIIVDLMQFLAGKVKYTGPDNAFDAEGISRSMRSVVESYMYSNEYSATKAIVALFDTPKNVPTNKARTQKKRQATTSSSSTILDEATYVTHSAVHDATGLGDLLKWPVAPDTIWRSNNLKFQLYACITDELLKIVPIEGLKLLIDDGASVNHALYVQRRNEMITHYFFNDRSTYEQECLVANLARHHFTERFMVSDEGVTRLPQTGTGEADVKIPRFIVYGNKTERYLVVSQDTDILFILLLHMKSLLPFEQGLEVWLDTQTPNDRKMGASRLYRFINVKELYNAIIDLFEREYPDVKNPIETLVFLVYALETDFTSGFDSCLRVTPPLVWNTFASLHTVTGVEPILFNAHIYDPLANEAKDTSVKMGVKRSGERQCMYPLKWRGVLNDAVTYGYDAMQDQYEIVLDDVKCQSFLYLLCQLRVLDDLSALGYTQFDKKKGLHRTYIPTSDELFIWTGEIEAKLEAYRLSTLTTATEEETKKRKAQVALAEQDLAKKAKVSLPLSPLSNSGNSMKRSSLLYKNKKIEQAVVIVIDDGGGDMIVDEIEEIEEEDIVKGITPTIPLSMTIKKKMADLVKKEMPKDYGVPRLDAMIARIYRTQWVMNYHQNGWKTRDYMTNFADTHPSDDSLSLRGWRAREIIQSEVSIKRGDFNSSYYTSVFQEGIVPGVIPFKVYEMVESDHVYNRSHAAYSDFGV